MELGDGAGEDPLVGLGSGGQSRTAQPAHQGGGRPLLLLHVGAGPPLLPTRRRVCDPAHTCAQFVTVIWGTVTPLSGSNTGHLDTLHRLAFRTAPAKFKKMEIVAKILNFNYKYVFRAI
jgi:hypothetical protein